MENANSKDYLEKIRNQVIDNLRHVNPAPSVQMADVPRESLGALNDEDEAELDDLDADENVDKRNTKRRMDQMVEKDGELSESEDEEMNEANGIRHLIPGRKKRDRTDYRNLDDLPDSGIDSGAGTPQQASSMSIADNNDADEDMADQDQQSNASGTRSSPVAEETNDVSMEDAGEAADGTVDAEVLPGVLQEETPPDSPQSEHPAAPTTEAEPSDAVTMTVAEENHSEEAKLEARAEGEAEREEENLAAEAATEAVAKAEE